jgi:hypothetical protein
VTFLNPPSALAMSLATLGFSAMIRALDIMCYNTPATDRPRGRINGPVVQAVQSRRRADYWQLGFFAGLETPGRKTARQIAERTESSALRIVA